MPGAALVIALTLAHARRAPPPRAMILAAAPNRQVLIVRRAEDGTLETACVDNDDAMRAFFAGTKPKAERK